MGSDGGTASSSSGSNGGSSGGSSGASGGGGSGSSSGGGSGSSSSGVNEGGSGGSDGSSGDGGANACTKNNAVCTCSNNGCNVGSYYLYDNQWNCGGNNCGPESAYGCANMNNTVGFVVTSNQPKGNTAVLSYPAMQDNFNAKPLLSSFNTITATFDETSPHVGDYEVAWDCWFNNNANELMIWVDNYNQAPAGNKVASAVSLGGRAYDVWWAPSMGTGGYVVFYANTTVTSGTVDLLEIFKYAATHGWLPPASSSTVDQLSFGVEICSTDGQDATWTFDDYAITAN
jgi:hypothetical protein